MVQGIRELIQSEFVYSAGRPRLNQYQNWGAAFAVLCAFLFSPTPAWALRTSENALHIEDSKKGALLLGADFAEIEVKDSFEEVVLLWGNLAVRGHVKKLVVLSGKVVFHPESKLDESLVLMGGSFDSLPGAQVSADKVTLKAPGALWSAALLGATIWRDNIGWVGKLLGALSAALIFWLSGLAIFSMFPKFRNLTADRLGQDWAVNMIAAFLGTILTPVVMVLLIVSVVGIALLPFYFLLLALAALLSFLVAGLWVGHRLLPPKQGSKINPLGFFLGLLALQLFWVVGGWGWIPFMLLYTLGWGSVVRAARGVWR